MNGVSGVAPWIGESRKPLPWGETWQRPKAGGMSLAVTQAESFSGRGSKGHSWIWAAIIMLWLHFSHFTPQSRCTNGSSVPNPPSSLDSAPPFLLFTRYALLYYPLGTLAPSTCPSSTRLILSAIWMSTTFQVPDQRPLHLGCFSDPCQSLSIGQTGVWVLSLQSPAVWHWALSLF